MTQRQDKSQPTPSPTLARIVEMARDERVAYDDIARHLGCACGGGCESTESEDIEAIRLALVAAHERGQRMGQPKTSARWEPNGTAESVHAAAAAYARCPGGTGSRYRERLLEAALAWAEEPFVQPTEHPQDDVCHHSAQSWCVSGPNLMWCDDCRANIVKRTDGLWHREPRTSDGKIASGRRQEVVEQLCKMMGRAYDCVDPYAHEPCDCVCTDKGLRSYQNASHALTFMEECISEGIARRGRTANGLTAEELRTEVHRWRHCVSYWLGHMALTASPEECRAEGMRRAIEEDHEDRMAKIRVIVEEAIRKGYLHSQAWIEVRDLCTPHPTTKR